MVRIDTDMPKNCLDCPISHEYKIDYCVCGKTGKNVYMYVNEIHPNCPLAEMVTCKDCAVKQYDQAESEECRAEKYFCPKIAEYVDETPNFYCADAKRRD